MKRILIFFALASCALAGTWISSPGKGSHAAAGGGTTFQDTFNVSNQNPMPTTSTSGGTWTLNVDGAQNLQVVSNECAATDTGGSNNNMARVASPTLSADQVAGITVGSSGAANISVSVRGNSTGANNYTLSIVSSDILAVYEANSGSYTQMGGNIGITSLVAGDIVDIRATGTSTTTLTVLVNSVSQGTRTDSTSPHTSGQPLLNLFGTQDVQEFHASNYP